MSAKYLFERPHVPSGQLMTRSSELPRQLERAREVTRNGKYTCVEYARFADDLVILVDAYKRHD